MRHFTSHLSGTMMTAVVFSIVITGSVFAQGPPAAGLNMIQIADLKKDLYTLADAHFRGRSAGTLDELKASAWLGEKFREIGLKPAGEDGTYFQFFTLLRNQLTDSTGIRIGDTPLRLWKEVMISQWSAVTLDAPIVYLGDAAKVDTNTVDVKGKAVAIDANGEGINLAISLPTWRYNRYVFAKYGLPLLRRGAAAIIFIADGEVENAWNDAVENYKRGTYDIEEDSNTSRYPRTPVTALSTSPVLWLHADAKKLVEANSATLKLNLTVSNYTYPSVNVVGVVRGTDPKLRSEYLLYSGHSDAHGIRNVINGDSIYYGADDNASVDVAMLADARAFVKSPSRRPVLFVIHGAEERGLFGSRFYSAHPTVPLKDIVAVINGDMIGRNNIDSAALLGVNPPHRNSRALAAMALDANKEGPNFKLDTTWDSPKHIEVWYFRSDHLPYARLGIPAIMVSSLLHPDYHTPQDRSELINYPKLKKMADWMYRTGWKVANAALRPATEKDFKLER